jgi:hypothetical protein
MKKAIKEGRKKGGRMDERMKVEEKKRTIKMKTKAAYLTGKEKVRKK